MWKHRSETKEDLYAKVTGSKEGRAAFLAAVHEFEDRQNNEYDANGGDGDGNGEDGDEQPQRKRLKRTSYGAASSSASSSAAATAFMEQTSSLMADKLEGYIWPPRLWEQQAGIYDNT